MAEDISLEFIGAQLGRVLTRLDSIEDEIRVLSTIVLRHDNTLSSTAQQIQDMLGQMRAMVRQHSRFNDRLRRLEEHPAE